MVHAKGLKGPTGTRGLEIEVPAPVMMGLSGRVVLVFCMAMRKSRSYKCCTYSTVDMYSVSRYQPQFRRLVRRF